MTDPSLDEVTALVVDLGNRFERVERALLGDPEVGHLGAIERLNQIDGLHSNIDEIHQSMEDRRISGDRRAHERIDEQGGHLRRVEKKIDRLWWMLIGSTGAGVAIGWGIAGAPPLT